MIQLTAFAALALLVQGPALSVDRGIALRTGADDPPVTFAKDVAPILQRNCQICHQPGAIAPMSLMTYEEVRPWAPLIKVQVAARNMPPYHYDTGVGIQELKQDRRLSEEDIGTIVRWVDAGAPMGDPSDLPPPVAWADPGMWKLAPAMGGPPDLVLGSPPFTVPAAGNDMWLSPEVQSGLVKDRWIRAIEIKPSLQGRASAHHVTASFESIGPDGKEQRAQLTEYALGKLGEIVPEGAGRPAPAHGLVTWSIHYSPSGKVIADDVIELGLWLHPEDYEPKYKQTLINPWLVQGSDRSLEEPRDLVIAPGGTLMTQGLHTYDHPVRIDSFQPHGHLRLKGMSLEILYPKTGRREMVSRISNWNPGWHTSHIYQDHVAPLVPTGAVVILTGWYDNTAANPHNPDPEVWVGPGQRTADEMSTAWLALTHLTEEEYDALLAERAARKAEAAVVPGESSR